MKANSVRMRAIVAPGKAMRTPMTFNVRTLGANPLLASIGGGTRKSPRHAAPAAPAAGAPVAEGGTASNADDAARSDAPPATWPSTDVNARDARDGAHTPPATRPSTPRRRPSERKDGGDQCDATDSAQLQRRQEALSRLTGQDGGWRNVSRDATKCIMRCNATLSIADIVSLVNDVELCSVLQELGQRVQANPAMLDKAPAEQRSVMVAMLREIGVRTAAGNSALVSALAAAFQQANAPDVPAHTWRDAAAKLRVQDHAAAQGPNEVWSMHMATMRMTFGYLTDAEKATKLDVAFDEGAEISCITIRALRKAQADFDTGCPRLVERLGAKPSELLVLDKPITIEGFQGTGSACQMAAHVHLRLGSAVYPTMLFVVPDAPADVMLGLNFVTEFCRPPPRNRWKHYSPLWEVQKKFLGVPAGYHRKRHNEHAYTQELDLHTEWRPWPVGGSAVPTSQCAAFLKDHFLAI